MTFGTKRGAAALIVCVLGSVPAYFVFAREGCACERPSAVMRHVLRNLVPAQESYYSERGTYTASRESLALESLGGTELTIVEATRDGWRAKATYRRTKGTCWVFIGRSQPPPIAGMTEGEVRCTRIRGLLLGRW